jgi:hypothetical protein
MKNAEQELKRKRTGETEDEETEETEKPEVVCERCNRRGLFCRPGKGTKASACEACQNARTHCSNAPPVRRKAKTAGGKSPAKKARTEVRRNATTGQIWKPRSVTPEDSDSESEAVATEDEEPPKPASKGKGKARVQRQTTPETTPHTTDTEALAIARERNELLRGIGRQMAKARKSQQRQSERIKELTASNLAMVRQVYALLGHLQTKEKDAESRRESEGRNVEGSGSTEAGVKEVEFPMEVDATPVTEENAGKAPGKEPEVAEEGTEQETEKIAEEL